MTPGALLPFRWGWLMLRAFPGINALLRHWLFIARHWSRDDQGFTLFQDLPSRLHGRY